MTGADPDRQSRPTAASAAAVRDWPSYYDKVAGKPPRDTLLDALKRFDDEPKPDSAPKKLHAIDLGCGEGRDTAELISRGWNVLAIDAHEDGISRLLARPELNGNPSLETRIEGFGESELPEADLVNASFALPFCKPERFESVWAGITRSIRPGGRFSGQLFGDRDSWATIEDRTHLTRERALALFDGFVLESFREEDRPGEDCHSSHKHWHVFHIVAKMRQA